MYDVKENEIKKNVGYEKFCMIFNDWVLVTNEFSNM